MPSACMNPAELASVLGSKLEHQVVGKLELSGMVGMVLALTKDSVVMLVDQVELARQPALM